MPRKPTGRMPGRPRVVRTVDGVRVPSAAQLTPKAKAWVAIELEVLRAQSDGKASLGRALVEDAYWPVAKAPHLIANRALVTAAAVRKWRRERVSRIAFLARALEAFMEPRSTQPNARSVPGTLRQMMAQLHPHWPSGGSVVSPINGRKCRSLETYVRHLRANSCVHYMGPVE